MFLIDISRQSLAAGIVVCVFLSWFWPGAVTAQTVDDTGDRAPNPGVTPDLRKDEIRLKLQKNDFVIVPIPMSNPTLDTGLIAGGAYFYPQTEDEAKAQPASVTAAVIMYTSSDSYAYGIAQQNYWADDRWRFSGALGHVDLRLSLLTSEDGSPTQSVDWLVKGNFLQAQLSKKIRGHWYAGLFGRFVDIRQTIEFESPVNPLDTNPKTKTSGVGINLEYDRRDMPINTYSGNYFEARALFNIDVLGGSETYQSYGLAYRSYHRIRQSLVLAWEIEGCTKGGSAPLWDACRVDLRGFSATDYLGKASAAGQVEARYRLDKRWGVTGFAGAGYVGSSFNDIRERELIPSYGAGIRFMVLAAKRINLRLDYGRSTDSNAIYFSVGEAF